MVHHQVFSTRCISLRINCCTHYVIPGTQQYMSSRHLGHRYFSTPSVFPLKLSPRVLYNLQAQGTKNGCFLWYLVLYIYARVFCFLVRVPPRVPASPLSLLLPTFLFFLVFVAEADRAFHLTTHNTERSFSLFVWYLVYNW